jgi:carboxymethylenebutenolidase
LSIHVSENDPRLDVEDIKFLGKTGDIYAHLAKPKEGDKLPGVVVIHENRGLNPHTKEVARRIALEGFLALAPNALSPLGGTPDDIDEARSLMRELDEKENTKNFVAAVRYLKTHPYSSGKVGVTGFCWGGGVTNQVAVHSPDVQAAVPFYGRQPSSEDVPKIKASLLIHYAGDDERINEGISSFEKALKEASIEYKIFMYEGAKHAFFNDTGSRYHEEASKLAWERTIEFFKEKLIT